MHTDSEISWGWDASLNKKSIYVSYIPYTHSMKVIYGNIFSLLVSFVLIIYSFLNWVRGFHFDVSKKLNRMYFDHIEPLYYFYPPFLFPQCKKFNEFHYDFHIHIVEFDHRHLPPIIFTFPPILSH